MAHATRWYHKSPVALPDVVSSEIASQRRFPIRYHALDRLGIDERAAGISRHHDCQHRSPILIDPSSRDRPRCPRRPARHSTCCRSSSRSSPVESVPYRPERKCNRRACSRPRSRYRAARGSSSVVAGSRHGSLQAPKLDMCHWLMVRPLSAEGTLDVEASADRSCGREQSFD